MPNETHGGPKEQTREWIRAARGKLTQEEFAQRVGVARETVARWESGASEASYRHIVKIAEAFPDTILIDGAPPAARALLPRVDALRLEREMEREADYAKESQDRGFLQSLREEFEHRIEETHGEGWAGLPPGLLKFLKARDADLTPREKTILMKSRVRWDRDFEFDDAFWWLIVKLFLRGFFIPPKDFILPAQRADPIPTLSEIEKDEEEREKAKAKKEEDEDREEFNRFMAGMLAKLDAAVNAKTPAERPKFTYPESRWRDRLIHESEREAEDVAKEENEKGFVPPRNSLERVFQEWRKEKLEEQAKVDAALKKAEMRQKDEEGT